MKLARLIEHLADPRVYPGPTTTVEIHQTHISVVFVTDSFAYKIKKPVALEFVDYSTLDNRRHWCDEEVRLNRRLAGRIYLGVVPIAEDGPGVRVEGTGSVVEWAVKMHRLPAEASLARAVERDAVRHEAVESLAQRIADFHRHAHRDTSISRFGRFDVVARNARDNFEQSASQVGATVSATVFERLRVLTEETLARHRALIENRADRGVACEGHGDIRMDHVYFFPENGPPDDLAIVDCIEFNLRFRAADPVADMAFLVMDLIRHGRRDLAQRFRDVYLAYASDDQGARLVAFYVAYRAAVRAKVNGIKANSSELSAGERTKAMNDARAQWLLALGALEDRRRRPCLVLIGGLPGTGKSTLAHALASYAGFEVIRSDQVRKELVADGGLREGERGEPRRHSAPTELRPPGVTQVRLAHANEGADSQSGDEYASGIYTPEWNERTYRECLSRAEAALWNGQRVIVDASFRDESQRPRFVEMATQWCVPVTLLFCQADAALVKTRLEERRNDVSDADWAIYQEAARRWEPLGPRSQQIAHAIDTTGKQRDPLIEALDALRGYELWE
jgi:uncharacterized protein